MPIILHIPEDPTQARDLYRSLHLLRSHGETHKIIDWMDSELTRLDIKSRKERDEEGEMRGARQVLESLLNHITQSTDKVSKITDNIQKRKGQAS